MFSEALIIDEVPADPNTYFLGEEFLFSVPAWTRGYDIYHPNEVACWHHYNDKCTSRPLHWQDNDWMPLDYLSAERFRKILGLEVNSEDFGIYGLGDNRTLSAYIKICNISLDKWIESCVATKCFSGDSINAFVWEPISGKLQDESNKRYSQQIPKSNRLILAQLHQLISKFDFSNRVLARHRCHPTLLK